MGLINQKDKLRLRSRLSILTKKNRRQTPFMMGIYLLFD